MQVYLRETKVAKKHLRILLKHCNRYVKISVKVGNWGFETTSKGENTHLYTIVNNLGESVTFFELWCNCLLFND